MDRRLWLKGLLGGIGAAGTVGAAFAKEAAAEPKTGIVLYCDLEVDPAKEAQMLNYFHTVFKPAAQKFAGYIDLKILKYDHLVQGPKPPAAVNYRFQLTYASLELQQKWVNSPTHVKLWPGMAATLKDQNFQVLVFNYA